MTVGSDATRSVVGRQEAASRLRREKIVAAATESFAERGYEGTTLREVATRAGLSHTGLMHHFPEKAALLEAALDASSFSNDETYGLSTATGEDFFRALLDLTKGQRGRRPAVMFYIRMAAEATSPAHPAHGYVREWFAYLRVGVQRALDDLAGKGLYRTPQIPTAMAALHLTAFNDGMELQWLHDDDIDMLAAARAIFGLYIDLDAIAPE